MRETGMARVRIRVLGSAVLLLVALAACARGPTEVEGVARVTVALDSNALGGAWSFDAELTPLGAPYDPVAGTSGVTEAILRVYRAGTEVFFDATGNEVPTGGVTLDLAGGALTLNLPHGTYTFEVAAGDGTNALADGALTDVVIGEAVSLLVPLASFVETVTLSMPETVVPNQVIDVRLGVHPPGRGDLLVPTADFTVEYSTTAVTHAGSSIGVRLTVECEPIDVTALVSDLRGNQTVEAQAHLAAADVCSSYAGGVGVDLIPPHLTVDDLPSVIMPGSTLTLTGTVNDGQTGVHSVTVFDGPVPLGNAVVDTADAPNPWSFQWVVGSSERSLNLIVVATDVAGSESRVSVTGYVQAASGWVAIAGGANHTCGVHVEVGTACWGSNDQYQLGSGAPVQVLEPVQVVGGIEFTVVSAGPQHTCGLGVDLHAYCWGQGSSGQLGNGSGTTRSTPVPVTLPLGVTLNSISVGWTHSCGVSTDGDTYCWGYNSNGQLGNGSTTNSNVPIPVNLPTGVTLTNITAGFLHSCGVSTNGAAYCWGRGNYGQLGNGSTTSSSIPALVNFATGMTLTNITARYYHSCGVSTNGDAYCWGRGNFGQLGNGSTADSEMPVPVNLPNGVTLTNITAGYYHSCGVSTNGTAYCWGYGNDGQLGNGSTANRSTPVEVLQPN